MKCLKHHGKYWVNPKEFAVKKAGWWGKTFGWLGNIFKSIGKFFGNIFGFLGNLFGIGKYIKWIMSVIVLAGIACVFFNCGGPLILKGLIKSVAIGKITNL